MQQTNHDGPYRLGRRALFGKVGALALAGSLGGLGLARPARADDDDDDDGGRRGLGNGQPAPKPIPGVIPSGLPPGNPLEFIHWWLPGPAGLPTPVLGIPGFGLDVDPSTMTDFDGFTAFAVLAGEARDAQGQTYPCEFDVRVMQGKYRADDGSMQHGTFGFL